MQRKEDKKVRLMSVGAWAMIVLVCVCGCSKPEEKTAAEKGARSAAVNSPTGNVEAADFVIPPSLGTRMQNAYQVMREKWLEENGEKDEEEEGKADIKDVYELMAIGKEFTNAIEICSRERGEMKEVDDLLSDEERSIVWPIDVESIEAELEKKMVIDSSGMYRLKAGFSNCPVNDDGYVAPNPTMRYINAEMERLSIEAMDKVELFPRMPAKFCEMLWDEEVAKTAHAWMVDEDVFFVILPCEGSWGMRSYLFVRWKKGGKAALIAEFDSMPSRKEASAALLLRDSAAAPHNLAVLMWRHQCDRLKMRPWVIREFLEVAEAAEVPTAAANLEVLRAHIPEAFEQ